jgi:hypothetical protein
MLTLRLAGYVLLQMLAFYELVIMLVRPKSDRIDTTKHYN